MYKTLSIRCQATGRAEKHKTIRKNYFDARSMQDKNLKKSLSSIAKDERERVNSIWEAHKSFFMKNTEEDQKEVSVEPELVVESTDLETANDFFED